MPSIQLYEVASARSGDKGNHANIGVIAKSREAYEYLQRVLLVPRVLTHFGCEGNRAVRYELPRVWAFNFVLYDVLAGGASESLKIDTQGKLLGTRMMQIELPISAEEAARLGVDTRVIDVGERGV